MQLGNYICPRLKDWICMVVALICGILVSLVQCQVKLEKKKCAGVSWPYFTFVCFSFMCTYFCFSFQPLCFAFRIHFGMLKEFSVSMWGAYIYIYLVYVDDVIVWNLHYTLLFALQCLDVSWYAYFGGGSRFFVFYVQNLTSYLHFKEKLFSS
jgi:hypothetical protein